jgi:hypothetical protein
MIELTDTMVIEERDFPLDQSTTLFPFALLVLQRKKTLYALKKAEKEMWVRVLKEVIGYTNMLDIYTIKVSL